MTSYSFREAEEFNRVLPTIFDWEGETLKPPDIAIRLVRQTNRGNYRSEKLQGASDYVEHILKMGILLIETPPGSRRYTYPVKLESTKKK